MKPTEYFDQFCSRYEAYKNGAWCYEDGCIYRGLELLYKATGEQRWFDHLIRLISPQVGKDGSLAGYTPDEFNIDNILPGRNLLFLDRETGDPRYMAAAKRLIAQLDTHPRIPAGNYWHKKRYHSQVWLDGLYMGLPFQVEYAMAAGETPRISDALQQMATALALTAIGGGMHVHGYDDSRKEKWADSATGKSPAVWARAMGWQAMALVDILAVLPDDHATAALRRQTGTILTAIANRQQASGLWPQVLDAPDLDGNYEETSASAMFAYALSYATDLHLDAPDMQRVTAAGAKAVDALADTRLIDEDGETRLTGICQVAGLGPFNGRYRDGSPEYYLVEEVVSDDAKGVGPFMMAYAQVILSLKDQVAPVRHLASN
ncbi:glycoside hydrolase family 88 protein [Neorhizobium sp. JUb45]|uniref:glycoside hydrolase family 88/105 protein n=1 Tax=unclassified Neorhizobium TaxID=2629175 RepID=UPI0010534C8A|nr:glycoside hydrolase family 88 protein [Neorhizobium sp. JUb45]TCR03302.1 unsaturated rhamnogalacturonyl hydrolase [Neorhizobium sp. JUb45]